jgi:hypothetical protein
MDYQEMAKKVEQILAKDNILKELNRIDSKLRQLNQKSGENAEKGIEPTSEENDCINKLVEEWKLKTVQYLISDL